MPTRTLYKLTDENMRTYGGFQWELGVKVKTNGQGGLCGPGWLHAYSDPVLAVLLSPIHVTYPKPRLFRAEGGGAFVDDHGLKCGVTELTLVEELTLPEVTVEQRVKFAILCAMEVCTDQKWREWAEKWLSGENRSREATRAAADAAYAAADAAYAAAWAAYAAADAAYAAAAAAYATIAANAAVEAAWAHQNLDLVALAKKAVE